MKIPMRTLKFLSLLCASGALTLIAGGSDWAQSSAGEQASQPGMILAQIRHQLSLGPSDPVDPSQVPDKLLEQLGDAVMEQMVPNEQQHEWMDRMMGGEGSESLASAHRWLAYRYLTGGYGPGGGGSGAGMMGSGMMGGSPMGGWSMMGNPAASYASIPYDSPEQVIRRRYSGGQIARAQYLQMMKDLRATPEGLR